MVQSGHPTSSTLRQLKWLVVLLILSNVALGVFGFSVLRTIDRRYSELVVHSVPLLNNLQTLTARSVDAMRGTGPTLLDAPAAVRADVLRDSRETLRVERAFRLKLLKDFYPEVAQPARAEFEKSGETFTSLAGHVLDLIAAGQMEDAKKFRDAQLRPAFDRYLVGITKAADEIEAVSLRASDGVSAQTGSMSHVLLGVGSWPVIVIIGLLLFTAAFVLGLMILFRGREMNDMP